MASGTVKHLVNQDAILKQALKYLAWFGLVYLVFIHVYSFFYFNFVAKGGTVFFDHVLWWLKLSGIWYITAPLSLVFLTLQQSRRPLTYTYLLLGTPLVVIAVVLQLLFDYSYVKDDILGYFVLFVPRQVGFFVVTCLYWYLFVYQRNILEQQHNLHADAEQELQKPSQECFVELEQHGRPIKLDVESIYQITSAGNYVEIETERGQFLKRASLKQMQNELPDYFCQCHRSHIINLHQVSAVKNQSSGAATAVLNNGRKVTISKRCKPIVKQKLSAYPIASNSL